MGKNLLEAGIVSLCIFFICGCQSWLSWGEIPQRVNFNGNIRYHDFKTLQSAYREHFKHVSGELITLERRLGSSDSHDKIEQQITEHQEYLKEMEEYRFLCPEHKTDFESTEQEKCISCSGKGRTFWGTCKECSGKGQIIYIRKITRKCSVCGELYRGRIRGKDLK